MDKKLQFSFENEEIKNFVNKYIPDFNNLMEKLEKFANHEKKVFSIYFVSDETIKKLNNEYRKKNEVTDVLSFELNDDKEDLYIGEIIFAPDYFYKKAQDLNENVSQYFLYMILHSYLHLNGWDHDNEEKYIKFENKTEELLRRINNL